jgi:hypothetical protein
MLTIGSGATIILVVRARALLGGWALTAVLAVGWPGAAAGATVPIGAHSMLQLNDPPSFMETMFAQAAAMGASEIRLDVAPAFVFSSPNDPPDFSGLDEVMALSTQYHLPVVADLLTIPWWMADCARSVQTPSDDERCATDDLTDYGSVIGQIVAHADPVIRDWEVWNEPDTAQFFNGTPAQYALMLRTAHDAIDRVDPNDRVLLGGVSTPAATGWLAQVFATPGADAIHAFDVANLHDRNQLDALAGDVTGFRQFLAGAGFSGPLWITEHGYPSDPVYQYDHGFAGGAAAQAAFLTASVPTLVGAGAAEVFVTERDNLGGQYASEGVLGGDVTDPPTADPQVVEKPAYSAMQTLAGCFEQRGRDCLQAPPSPAPSSITLAPVTLHGNATATVAVTDPGAQPVVIGAAAVTGPEAGAFTIADDDCSQRLLEPDERCSILVRFRASAGGASTAALALPSDQGTATVPLAATVPSVSALAAAPPDFVAVDRADGPGHPQVAMATLRNPLGVSVHVQTVRLSGSRRFSLAGNPCAEVTLGPGATCRVPVLWLPGSAGPAHATITVGGDGTPLTVALDPRAAALPRVVALRPSSACLSTGAPLRVRAVVTTPGRVAWTIRRAVHPANRRCRPGHPSAGPERFSAHGSSRASGRPGTRGTARLVLAGGARWEPGTYRLTVIPIDGAGAGRPATAWLTAAATR